MRTRSDKTEIRRLRQVLRNARTLMDSALKRGVSPGAFTSLTYGRRLIDDVLRPARRAGRGER